jgi:hypothetical protein
MEATVLPTSLGLGQRGGSLAPTVRDLQQTGYEFFAFLDSATLRQWAEPLTALPGCTVAARRLACAGYRGQVALQPWASHCAGPVCTIGHTDASRGTDTRMRRLILEWASV